MGEGKGRHGIEMAGKGAERGFNKQFQNNDLHTLHKICLDIKVTRINSLLVFYIHILKYYKDQQFSILNSGLLYTSSFFNWTIPYIILISFNLFSFGHIASNYLVKPKRSV